MEAPCISHRTWMNVFLLFAEPKEDLFSSNWYSCFKQSNYQNPQGNKVLSSTAEINFSLLTAIFIDAPRNSRYFNWPVSAWLALHGGCLVWNKKIKTYIFPICQYTIPKATESNQLSSGSYYWMRNITFPVAAPVSYTCLKLCQGDPQRIKNIF